MTDRKQKYSIFELLEDPEKSEKSIKVLKEEALSRGWEECSNPEQVKKIVLNMMNEGFVLVSNDPVGAHGPSALGNSSHGAAWGRALYFKKKG